MPVGLILTMPRITLDVYDQFLDSETGDRLDADALMHFAHRHGDGVRIVEIWPDRQKMDEFLEWIQPQARAMEYEWDLEVIPEIHRHFHKHVPHKRKGAAAAG